VASCGHVGLAARGDPDYRQSGIGDPIADRLAIRVLPGHGQLLVGVQTDLLHQASGPQLRLDRAARAGRDRGRLQQPVLCSAAAARICICVSVSFIVGGSSATPDQPGATGPSPAGQSLSGPRRHQRRRDDTLRSVPAPSQVNAAERERLYSGGVGLS
jgi:hypothetical protein